MFTPLAAGNKRLRPWIALVVLPVTGEYAARPRPEELGRLPVLTVTGAEDLPPIDETWAWAHAQFVTVTSAAASTADLAASRPRIKPQAR